MNKKQLQEIPGVGPSISADLDLLGYFKTSDLKGEDPQTMYDRLCEIRGKHLDRCLLYVFHCAVYYASNENHDPELLKWWTWKKVLAEKASEQ
jgi:hypothetical protein